MRQASRGATDAEDSVVEHVERQGASRVLSLRQFHASEIR